MSGITPGFSDSMRSPWATNFSTGSKRAQNGYGLISGLFFHPEFTDFRTLRPEFRPTNFCFQFGGEYFENSNNPCDLCIFE